MPRTKDQLMELATGGSHLNYLAHIQFQATTANLLHAVEVLRGNALYGLEARSTAEKIETVLTTVDAIKGALSSAKDMLENLSVNLVWEVLLGEAKGDKELLAKLRDAVPTGTLDELVGRLTEAAEAVKELERREHDADQTENSSGGVAGPESAIFGGSVGSHESPIEEPPVGPSSVAPSNAEAEESDNTDDAEGTVSDF